MSSVSPVLDQDLAVFDPSSFGLKVLSPFQGPITAHEKGITIDDKTLCVITDVDKFTLKCIYINPPYIGGSGTLYIKKLAADQVADFWLCDEVSTLIVGSKFKAEFVVEVPGINPSNGQPDSKSKYTGEGSFQNVSSTGTEYITSLSSAADKETDSEEEKKETQNSESIKSETQNSEQGTSVAQSSSVPEGAANNGAKNENENSGKSVVIPKKAYEVLEFAQNNNGAAKVGYESKKFKNHEKRLPPGNYKEYDVDPRPKEAGQTRNAERIVVEQNSGKAFYTNDHYASFTPMN